MHKVPHPTPPHPRPPLGRRVPQYERCTEKADESAGVGMSCLFFSHAVLFTAGAGVMLALFYTVVSLAREAGVFGLKSFLCSPWSCRYTSLSIEAGMKLLLYLTLIYTIPLTPFTPPPPPPPMQLTPSLTSPFFSLIDTVLLCQHTLSISSSL